MNGRERRPPDQNSEALGEVSWNRGTDASGAASERSVLSRLPPLRPGHVWLVGAGPGDPGLLTLYAFAGLAQADVVVHDALVDARILDLAGPQARRVFAGKRGGRPSVDQADITTQLIALARQRLRVLRLKGGDPYVFGRGGEEALGLAEQQVPFRVIPGITAGLGAMAAALIPATLRGVNQAILFATGHCAGSGLDWSAIAKLGQPIVLYMAVTRLSAIQRELLAGGLSPCTPAAIIHAATTQEQKVAVTTLGSLMEDRAAAALQPPAIVVIGQIVAMREKLMALLPVLDEEVRSCPLPV
jgi:uroporphyrin-III C-methyltransferase